MISKVGVTCTSLIRPIFQRNQSSSRIKLPKPCFKIIRGVISQIRGKLKLRLLILALLSISGMSTAVTAASLEVVQETRTGNVDLSAEGTTDWLSWTCVGTAYSCHGLVLPGNNANSTAPYARKSGGKGIGSVIYDQTLDAGGVIPLRYLGSGLDPSFSWSDGDSNSIWSDGQAHTSGSANKGVLQALAGSPGGKGTGFTVEVIAPSTGENEFQLHVGNFRAKGRLTAQLPGANAVTLLHSPPSGSNTSFRIAFSADTVGDKLTVKWEDTGSNGTYSNLSILAATFKAAAQPTVTATAVADAPSEPIGGVSITDDANITLREHVWEAGATQAVNTQFPVVAESGLVPYTATGLFNCCGPNYGATNLNDGDVGTTSDGLFAIPSAGQNAVVMDFGSDVSISGVAIYNGYGNRDDGDYTLKSADGTVLGSWRIGGAVGGVDSFWLAFDSDIITSQLILDTSGNENGTSSFREIQVLKGAPVESVAQQISSSDFSISQCKTMQTADVNGDGNDDLICPYDYGSAKTATFVEFSNDPAASEWTIWSSPTGSGSFAVGQCKTMQTGDVNGDGKADLICPYDYGGAKTKTFVQLSNGDSGSGWTSWSPLAASGSFAVGQCKPMQTGDVNGDGKDDLICSYDYSGTKSKTFVQFSSGATSSSWTAWSPETPSSSFAVDECTTLETGDVNSDGKADLICLEYKGDASLPTYVQLSNGSTGSDWSVRGENIALGKTATQSTTYYALTASKAVNGVINGDNGKMAHTQSGVGEWWQVDLGAIYNVSNSEWFNRTDGAMDRMTNYTVQRSNDGVSWTDVSNQTTQMGRPSVVPINAEARYIRLKQNKDTYINFAEARVFGTFNRASPVTDTAPVSQDPVASTGPIYDAAIFAQPLPTPQCDGWEDTVGDMATYVAREANDMAMAELNRWKDMAELAGDLTGDLVSGDFEGMADGIIDYSNQSMINQFEQGMKWASRSVDITTGIIPSGAVSEFLKDAEKTADVMGPMLIAMANPLNSVKGDLDEVGGDLLDMITNIDDPEEFGKAWITWQQQWNPVGSMTYLLTESDPMDGMKKAAARIQRQAEIFSTYIAPFMPAGKVVKFADHANDMAGVANLALGSEIEFVENGGGKKKVLKNLIAKSIGYAELKDKAKGFGMACLEELVSSGGICDNPIKLVDFDALDKTSTARLNLLVARTLAEVDVAGASGHPFYASTNIRDVPAIKLGDESSFKLYRPDVEGTSCIVLGDHAYTMLSGGSEPTTLPALCDVSLDADWWARPVDYKLVWGDNCSGGDDLSIWRPVCPVGYSHVGFVASGESTYRPSPDRIACLKNDPGIFQWVDGNEADVEWIDNDKNSGSKWDVTLMKRDFAGIPIMYATAGYPTVNQSYLAELDVPVALGIPGPDGIFSTMMTFETTTRDQGDAATDNPVFVVLQNAKGDTHRVLLDNADKDDAESGQTDTYDIYRQAAFGKVTAFDLDSSGGNGWNFSKVALKQVSKSLQVETMSFEGGNDYDTHTNQAIECGSGGCLNTGPGCLSSVSGQCSFPIEQAQELCGAHPQCVAITCNTNRDDCQARKNSTLSGWAGYTSYVSKGRWLDGHDGPHVQQFPDQPLFEAGVYSLQQRAETGGGRFGFINTSGDQVLINNPNGNTTFPNQRWTFQPTSCDHSLGKGSSNCYRLYQQSRNKYLDAHEPGLPGACGSNDCRVVTRSAQNDLSQVWILRQKGRGPEGGGNEYTLQQASNGQYLDGYEYGNAVTRTRQNDDSQTWVIRKVN